MLKYWAVSFSVNHIRKKQPPQKGKTAFSKLQVARVTGLEPATPGVTGRYSNQLSYTRASLAGRFLGGTPAAVNSAIEVNLKRKRKAPITGLCECSLGSL